MYTRLLRLSMSISSTLSPLEWDWADRLIASGQINPRTLKMNQRRMAPQAADAMTQLSLRNSALWRDITDSLLAKFLELLSLALLKLIHEFLRGVNQLFFSFTSGCQSVAWQYMDNLSACIKSHEIPMTFQDFRNEDSVSLSSKNVKLKEQFITIHILSLSVATLKSWIRSFMFNLSPILTFISQATKMLFNVISFYFG